MAVVYIVAGPPGVGKSTSGREFIPNSITVLDADLIAHKYRQQGFTDYKHLGNWRFQNILKQHLVSGKDFAIELNLGFQGHYDLLRNLNRSIQQTGSRSFFSILMTYSFALIAQGKGMRRATFGVSGNDNGNVP